ncbi:MAG: hypothetical protein M3N57_12920 [Actinomycetota bacterium]|nr:hypothetical protein [Actinomycetota bacterium]
MITGLMQAEPVRTRSSRQRLERPLAAAVALVVVAGFAAVAVQQAERAAPSDAELVDALVAIEDQVADVPLLPDATVSPDATWGDITGDFVGAAIQLEEIDPELQTLVAQASEARTPVADAVEAVASAYRTMREGYTFLSAYEQAGLVVAPLPPPAAAETPELAAGADEPRGQAQVGMVLLLEALAGFQEGYAVLRDAEAAGEARTLFQSRYIVVQQAAQTEADDVRDALSLPATERLVPVTRFEPRFTGEEPERTVRYACVDWDDYVEVRPEGPHPSLSLPEGQQADLPIPDCPDVDNGNEVRLLEPGTPA